MIKKLKKSQKFLLFFKLLIIILISKSYALERPRVVIPPHYPKLDQIEKWVKRIEKNHIDIVNIVYYGKSVKGEKENQNNLFSIEIANKQYEQKSIILITAGIHPRELITTYTAMTVVNQIINKIKNNDPFWIDYIKRVRIIIMPLLNPDGYEMVMNGWNWRKSIRVYKPRDLKFAPNSYGVNLNQNFDVNFRIIYGIFSLEWGGPEPFSEPETRSLRDYLKDKKIDASIALHSYGRHIAFPWWGKVGKQLPREDHEEHIKVGRATIALMKGYRLQKGCPYPVHGNFGDWIYKNNKCITFTFEIGDSFIPDYALCLKWMGEVLPGIYYLMDYILKKNLMPVVLRSNNKINDEYEELFWPLIVYSNDEISSKHLFKKTNNPVIMSYNNQDTGYKNNLNKQTRQPGE